jgi:hypothetical protein
LGSNALVCSSLFYDSFPIFCFSSGSLLIALESEFCRVRSATLHLLAHLLSLTATHRLIPAATSSESSKNSFSSDEKQFWCLGLRSIYYHLFDETPSIRPIALALLQQTLSLYPHPFDLLSDLFWLLTVSQVAIPTVLSILSCLAFQDAPALLSCYHQLMQMITRPEASFPKDIQYMFLRTLVQLANQHPLWTVDLWPGIKASFFKVDVLTFSAQLLDNFSITCLHILFLAAACRLGQFSNILKDPLLSESAHFYAYAYPDLLHPYLLPDILS